MFNTCQKLENQSEQKMEFEQIRAELEEVIARLQASENKIDELTHAQRVEEPRARNQPTAYDDIVTKIDTGDQIQLESYRSIPEFNGNKKTYRSWRNQVVRRMTMIEPFTNHAKYEAALGIIRAKITGAASDVLTNNKTAYNIHAIIERLDSSYADQRPLYVIEAEMTSIKQLNQSLQEYFDSVNQGLNLIISKIVMTYKSIAEQKPLIEEAQKRATRTFIIGLKSQTTRSILYSYQPKSLIEAFTAAQTVYYDNQFLHLDQNPRQEPQRNQPRGSPPQQRYATRGYPGMSPVQNRPTGFNVNMQCNQPRQQIVQQKLKPEPMDVDSSNRFKQITNWQQNNAPQKREYDSARQHQPNKIQRINQIGENATDPNEGYDGDICNDIPDELVSNSSHTSHETTTCSAFLDV